MRNLLIAASLLLIGTVAGAQDTAVTITPTYLYNKISALQKDEMRFRQQINEQLDCAAKTAFKVAQLEYKVKELERKIAGCQKQVTVLHATKASADDVQRLKAASILTHQAVNKLRK